MHRASIPTVIGKNYMTYVSHYCDIEAAEKLYNDGDFSSFRKWIKTGSDMFGNGHPQGLDFLTGETAEEITSYIISGKKSLLKKIEHLDKNSSDVMTLPFMSQFRTIRHIVGKADFNSIYRFRRKLR